MLQCNYVEKDRRHSHEPPPGIPIVSPEVIAAANAQPLRNPEDDFRQLQRENHRLALRVFAEATRRCHNEKEEKTKRAFVEGALYLYGLLSAEAESQYLKRLFAEKPTDGDADGEDRRLSA